MQSYDLIKFCKVYGKIEYEDDAVIESLLCAANVQLEAAGVPERPENPLWKLAVCRLALHYYENREEAVRELKEVPLGLRWMIDGLRYAGE